MGQSDINKLKSVENKLHTRIQKQLMDENSPTSGTLFETIQIINKQMCDKINLKLDLTKEPILQHEKEGEGGGNRALDAAASLQQKQEEKLDSFILKFINLNADNREILGEAKASLDKILEKRISDLQYRLD